MPIYTCTTVESALTADVKAALAGEIARIHSDDQPRAEHLRQRRLPRTARRQRVHRRQCLPPLLITGWVRDGHPEADTTRLATEIAAAATRVTGIPADRVLVVFESSPAHYAVEGGRVLPEPGHEAEWVHASQ